MAIVPSTVHPIKGTRHEFHKPHEKLAPLADRPQWRHNRVEERDGRRQVAGIPRGRAPRQRTTCNLHANAQPNRTQEVPMAEIIVEARQTNPLITLQSGVLAVAVTPGKGGDIVSIRHLPTGREVLWQTPWGGRPGGYTLPESDAAEAWVLGYTG